ncbi:MAG: sulfatase [Planctomycetota bacterium]
MALCLLATLVSLPGLGHAEPQRPNVLFFAVDDMNDWIGPMGSDRAITPNMDRLAARGVTFQNGHTAGIYCAPSRTAIFTGRFAPTTGCYTIQYYPQHNPDIVPLQMLFANAGYATYGVGKLYHHREGFVDLRGWTEFFTRTPEQRLQAYPLKSWPFDSPILPQPFPYSPFNAGREITGGLYMEWGPILNENEEAMADTIWANYAAEQVGRVHDRPFFVAVGLYAPHFPNYVPQKYFDMYDRDAIEDVPMLENDIDDLPERIRRQQNGRLNHQRRLEELGAVKDAHHGYLASITYADAMLGRVLDALEAGPNADNTIIVLWSDHGYHRGEKHWGKHKLWERTSNVPFMWAGPGIEKGKSIDATVSLIDMLPTFDELCDLNDTQSRDGVSLAPMLRDVSQARDRKVLLPGMVPEEYAIMDAQYRYIKYRDDAEELYDVQADPHEWHNVANEPAYASVKAEYRAAAPSTFAEPGLVARQQMRLVTNGEEFYWEPKE